MVAFGSASRRARQRREMQRVRDRVFRDMVILLEFSYGEDSVVRDDIPLLYIPSGVHYVKSSLSLKTRFLLQAFSALSSGGVKICLGKADTSRRGRHLQAGFSPLEGMLQTEKG
jgi:hypothetical protein